MTQSEEKDKLFYNNALEYHKRDNKPGKFSITPSKPLLTQDDLCLAYSPGVAYPCLEISKNPEAVYEYTAKGNYVAVVTNGTAVLGLGNIGPLASKPVMEGKSVLLKHFADIDAVDIEVDTNDPEEFVNCVKLLSKTWGAINLEDIKAPECFTVEQELQKVVDIPVFHDDQHGTAVIVAAGIINALDITSRDLQTTKFVLNGPGAAGLACINLLKKMGVPDQNVIVCDLDGVLYKGRDKSPTQWREPHYVETNARSLEDALDGADVFLGLSAKDALKPDFLRKMNKMPIVFAMANPDPEIRPESAKLVKPDVIIATGRSDYNNQINNVMAFPYLFRGSLDVHASCINDEMLIATVHAIAKLAREPIPEEVYNAYGNADILEYGPEYIVPKPFDPRLITTISVAVAKAAIKTGVARKVIYDWEQYTAELMNRLNPSSNVFRKLHKKITENPKRIIFSEGEEEQSIKAAVQWCDSKNGDAILVGRKDKIINMADALKIKDFSNIRIANAAMDADKNECYIDHMYNKLQRHGVLKRDCIRAVKTQRDTFCRLYACLWRW